MEYGLEDLYFCGHVIKIHHLFSYSPGPHFYVGTDGPVDHAGMPLASLTFFIYTGAGAIVIYSL